MPGSLSWPIMLAPLLLAGAGSFQGKEFPDFKAKDALTGKEFSLHDLRGKVVLIDFWATWCGPCVRELPNVKRVHGRYQQEGLEIVSISLDEDRKRFESFAQQKGMRWRHVMEGGGWGTRLAQQYGVNSIPRMIVLDAKGVCIADGVRGRRLDEVIQSSLGKVERPRRPDGQREPAAPAGPPALQQELEALREQLAEIAAPLKEVLDELAEIDEEIARLHPPVPSPGTASAQQVAALLERLRSVRQAMFMLGLVDEHNQVALPADPPEALPPGDARVAPILDSAQRSTRSMRELADGAAVRRAALEAKAAELERQASGKGGAASAIEPRMEALRSETDALAQRFGDSWVDRTEGLKRMIAVCAKSVTDADADLAEIGNGLRSLAKTADSLPRETGPLQALREAFNNVRRKLEEAALSAGAGNAVALPSDPFQGRSLRDTRALTELRVQLRVAQEAAAALRQKLAGQRGRIEALAVEAEALRRQVADRLQSGAAMEDLEQRFEELFPRALSLRDPG